LPGATLTPLPGTTSEQLKKDICIEFFKTILYIIKYIISKI
jgi:hypothetical protein